MGTYTEIRTEHHGHVEVITIDRPEARNALTHTTYAELTDAVEKVMANVNAEATSGQRLEKRDATYVGR